MSWFQLARSDYRDHRGLRCRWTIVGTQFGVASLFHADRRYLPDTIHVSYATKATLKEFLSKGLRVTDTYARAAQTIASNRGEMIWETSESDIEDLLWALMTRNVTVDDRKVVPMHMLDTPNAFYQHLIRAPFNPEADSPRFVIPQVPVEATVAELEPDPLWGVF